MNDLSRLCQHLVAMAKRYSYQVFAFVYLMVPLLLGQAATSQAATSQPTTSQEAALQTASSQAASAQATVTPASAAHIPHDIHRLGPSRLRVVRGAPFCAEAVHGIQQQLPDGNRINLQSRSRTCRDSEGRLRQEFERGTKTTVFLRDPTIREFWVMEPERRRARRLDRQGPAAMVLDHEQREAARSLMLHRLEERGAGQRSDLGQRGYEGIQVQGELTTWTIEAGRMGNEKALVITREVWLSPELMIPVSIYDRDPRFGERFLRVFNIKREEPEPELMRVPADFLKLETEQRRPRLLGP